MTVTRVHDSRQRRALLAALRSALDDNSDYWVRSVAHSAHEGDAASLYLFLFFDAGLRTGYRAGCEGGRDEAFNHVYGRKAKDVARRTNARRGRRKENR
jgi:hypothetical protein